MNIIKEMRQKYGLTQKLFSEITGKPKRTVEDWETEKRHTPEWLPKMILCYLETNQDVFKLDTNTQKNPAEVFALTECKPL